VEPPCTRGDPIQSYRRCVRCFDVVLCKSLKATTIVLVTFIKFSYQTDNLISGAKSTVPFSKTECEELSRVIRGLTGIDCIFNTFNLLTIRLVTSNEGSIARTVFLAWLLREVCSYRDAENWGKMTQRESQAARKQNLLPSHASARFMSPFALTMINFVINVLFFGIPHTYRAHVKVCSLLMLIYGILFDTGCHRLLVNTGGDHPMFKKSGEVISTGLSESTLIFCLS